MWLANLENGATVSEGKERYWDQMSREARLTGVQLVHPRLSTLHISLSNYDKYYFTREAISVLGAGSGEPTIVAETIGGHDTRLGIGVEVRLETRGGVRIKTYPIARFKYDPKILYDGRRNGNPTIATSPDAEKMLAQEKTK